MQASAALAPSPSLSSYSTAAASKLAEIAARVVGELGLDPDPFGCGDAAVDDFGGGGGTGRLLRPPGDEAGREEREKTQLENGDVEEAGEEEGEEEEEGEFEFEFAFVGPGSSPISADEIFYNGQIRPLYPVFNGDLLLNGVAGGEEGEDGSKKKTTTTKLRLPLKKLLSEDREWSSSSSSSTSSSESDDLDGLAPGSYCVWRPKDQSSAKKRRGKSNSTGSFSKRWRFRDLLLNRSSSDAKGTFLLVAPSTKKRDKIIGESKRVAAVAEDDDGDADEGEDPDAGDKDEGKRKPPLPPPRADIVGFFANANGLSRNLKLHPF
ncbi:hypothetical protein NL676_028800 [Syzygium grande]|nr:hypothetical protein NL676_028800 [Syzygium grande]